MAYPPRSTPRQPRTRCLRRGVLALGLGIVTSCSSWQATNVTPQQLIDHDHPNRVRLGRFDGEDVTIMRPTIAADSVVGTRYVTYPFPDEVHVGVPLDQIRTVAVRRPSGGRTVLLIVGVPLAALAILAALFATQPCCM